MALKGSVTLDISGGTHSTQLEKFLQRVPEGTPIDVKVRVTKADRPYESDHTSVEISATWDEE
jgi:hypothetical protein